MTNTKIVFFRGNSPAKEEGKVNFITWNGAGKVLENHSIPNLLSVSALWEREVESIEASQHIHTYITPLRNGTYTM